MNLSIATCPGAGKREPASRQANHSTLPALQNARCCNHSRCCSLHEICASGLLHEPVNCNLPRSATPICHALPRQCSRASSLSWFSTSLFQHQLVHCVATCQLWTSSCPTWPPSTWEPLEPVSQLLFLCANRKSVATPFPMCK